jgi:hypothetical protein
MAAVELDGSARVQQRLSDRWADYNRQGNGLKSRFRTVFRTRDDGEFLTPRHARTRPV